MFILKFLFFILLFKLMTLIEVEVIYCRKRPPFLMLDKSDKQFPFRKNEIMPSRLKNVFKNKINY